MDDQPTGSCVTCRRRDPIRGYSCNPCRSRMRSWLGEIPDLYAEALELAEDVDARVATALGAQSRSGPVSGSPEPRIPLAEDLFDLTHLGAVFPPANEDQVGHLSVLATLRAWAGYWSSFRAMGEVGHRAGIASVCSWMRERVDDMADEDEDVAASYEALGALRGALRSMLGERDPKPVKLHGVPCRRCGADTLWRKPIIDPTEDYWASECAVCGDLLDEEEYDEWIRVSAKSARRNGILRSDRPAA